MKIIPETIKFYAKVFLIYLVSFFVFRLLFFIRFADAYEAIQSSEIGKAFLIGLKTDITIINYAIAPFFLVGSLPFIGIEFSKISERIHRFLLFIMLTVFAFMHFANLEFFQEYNNHLNRTAIQYLDSFGMIVHMVWEDYPIVQYIIGLAIFISLLGVLFKKMTMIYYRKTPFLNRLIVFLLASGLLFLGIRGGTNESTINWGAAFFSKNMMVNQLALNPVFHLFKDFYYTNKAKKKNLLSKIRVHGNNEDAFQVVRSLTRSKNDTYIDTLRYPFYKKTTFEGEEKHPNIVIVLMESYAAEFAGCLGSELDITPHFDQLAEEGVLFTRFFSNGQRTNRGISSTFSSFPALNTKSILKQVEGQQRIPSIGSILLKKGYGTYFIHGGDLDFDNMHGFLISKGIENFVGEEDFNPSTFLNKWGAPDEFLFKRTTEILDSHQEKPFFGLLLTLTNHTPFTVPENFDKIATGSKYDANYNTTRYVDIELGKFIKEMKEKPYYENSIFVFLGDHSKSYHHDIAFDYRVSHTPCLIVGGALPDSLKGKRIDKFASQIDLVPTIFSMFNIESENSFLGRNLLSIEDDGFVLLANNSRIGFLENDLYWMGRIGQKGSLLKYNDFSGYDLSSEFKQRKDEMRIKMFSFAQSAYAVFKSQKIAPKAKSLK